MTTRSTSEGSSARPPATPEEIWAILRRNAEESAERAARWAESMESMKEETERLARENDRRAEENDRRAEENDRRAEENDRRVEEFDRRAEKFDREVAEAKLRAEERSRDLDRRIREAERRIRKAEDLFTTQWGKLMESLVEGDLAALLQARGIAVEGTTQRTTKRRNGDFFEIDILASNGVELVLVEVKTTLRSEGVTHFLGKLSRFGQWFPEYRDRRVYGAVAYLQGSDSVTRYAERQGLFVIRATGSSASIVNAADFKPRVFPQTAAGRDRLR